jgi:hypothetical protein
MSKLVFKIMKPAASFHGVNYNERKQQKGQASLIHVQNFGHLQDGRTQFSREDLKKYLTFYSKRNTRIRYPQFHAILSCREQSFTNQQLKEYALQLMQKLGYCDNPLLIYAHTDTKNNHIHIVSSRIDSDGRKTLDSYEGMKANKLLTDLLSINTQQECQQAVNEALEYKFSSKAQIKLLLEQKGYACRQDNDQMLLYKHGSIQGSLPFSVVKKQIESYQTTPVEIKCIQALILKYKDSHDCVLQKNENHYPSAAKALASPLTLFLHQQFGLEFKFFIGNNHDKPYGYAIIDHAHKTIYKGGDVTSLRHLTSVSDEKKFNEQIENESQRTRGRGNERTESTNHDEVSKDVVSLFDQFIKNIEYQVDQDLRLTESNYKGRKKREKLQRR